MNPVRQAFEAWFTKDPRFLGTKMDRVGNTYRAHSAHYAWAGWQARASSGVGGEGTGAATPGGCGPVAISGARSATATSPAAPVPNVDVYKARDVSCPICGEKIDRYTVINSRSDGEAEALYYQFHARDAVDGHREETKCPLYSTGELRFGPWEEEK